MKKLTLNVDELRVASFEIDDPGETVAGAQALVTGINYCTTRYPTVYGPCCTP